MDITLDQFLSTVHTPQGWDAVLTLVEDIPEERVKFFIVAGVRLEKIDVNFPLGSGSCIVEVTSETYDIPERIKRVSFSYEIVDLITKSYVKKN
jgi:hypothetical protein